MSDFTVTAQNVRPLDGSVTRSFTLGAALAPGDAFFIASDGDIEKADGNVDAASARARGIVVAIQGGKALGAAGDKATGVVFGPVAGFSGLTPGAQGYVSDNAGKIADAVATFDRFLGYCESATVFFVMPVLSDAAS
ncbi:MAG: hypothetical protein IT328_04580 [Caldilineaceae bacterium]|nr:hypothetical protein [Caldilineaceae bacterium]